MAEVPMRGYRKDVSDVLERHLMRLVGEPLLSRPAAIRGRLLRHVESRFSRRRIWDADELYFWESGLASLLNGDLIRASTRDVW